MNVFFWTKKKEMHTHTACFHSLTSSVQVEACLALLFFNGLVKKQSCFSVEASTKALNSKIIVGENQLKLHLLLQRTMIFLFISGLRLTSDRFLHVLAQFHSLD